MKVATTKPWILLFLIYGILATALLAPISIDTALPSIIDYTNHIASVIEAKLAFSEGQFPLRIAPLELSSWRYPYFQFYSPTTYTLAGLIHRWIIPSNPVVAVKFTIWLSLVMGGLFMQRLAYWFIKSQPIALLTGIVYLTAPYYIVVVSGFGNLCESLALGILPAVIYYSLQRYLHPKSIRTLLMTSLVWYLLITIHMITFVYSALFVTLLLFLVTLKNKRHWENWIATVISIGFGCLLATWYLGPIALLNKYLIIAQTFVSPALFQSFGPSLSTLLFPGHLAFQGPMGGKHVAIGWPMIIAVSLCLYALFNKSRISNVRANYWLSPLLILFFVALMLAWSPIVFLQWAPSILLVGQYCWRLLDQLIWIGALLFAWAMSWLFKNTLDLKQTVIGILLLIMAASTSFPTLYSSVFNINLADFIKKPFAIFNPDAYTIEFNKHTGFIDQIDTMRLDTLMLNNQLQLNTIYSFPQTLLSYTKTPKLILSVEVPDTIEKKTQLKTMINNTSIATFNLVPGKFHWEIPLSPSVLSHFKKSKLVQLQFKLNTSKPVVISVSELALTGFLPRSSTLNVKTVQPFCRQKKMTTICEMNVPKNTTLLELPILYYPKLLHITLNGQPVPYQSIVYQNNLIAGIVPIPGQNNLIKIQFVGLAWANRVSWLCWFLWAGLLAALFFKRDRSTLTQN